ncbi:hypothetical protein ACJIZ3_009621 [Penstemon smallii]|uniref:TF-B3 domain-containing protein n=1 Tax=Penstemon smallii TaxID=265156 RepID=A0ABD3TDU5_9LAMI
MNNFMSGRFYEEMTSTTPMSMSSSSSSSSSSLYHTYNHLQQSVGVGVGVEDSSDGLMRQDTGSGNTTPHVVMEKEHMFDKVVTPSDVGKLNRLVIPKQHAEKYFPLDSSTNEKGLLLNFEDRNGKPWRFRYSYWNSSQSYVMTKGWSRFVKEKKLDAGDIVSFQRGVGEMGKDRLFIDWRRRPDAPTPDQLLISPHHHHQFQYTRSNWNPLFMQPQQQPQSYSHLFQHQQHSQFHPHNYTIVNGNPCPPGSIVYLRGGGGGGILGGPHQQVGMGMGSSNSTNLMMSGVEQMVYDSVPVVQGKASAKRLRLFGVNMDCPISESDDCDINLSSSSTTTTPPPPPPPPPLPSIPNFHSSSNSSPSAIPNYFPRHPNYNYTTTNHQDKGKGSMSLDLDI